MFLGASAATAMLAGMGALGVIRRAAPTEDVVVYTRPVQRLQTITREDLTLAKLPAKGLPQDAIRRVEEAVGQVAVVGGLPGDVVRQAGIVRPASGEGPLALKLEALHDGQDPKRIAFALPGSTAGGIGSELRPGDRVDVLVVMDLPPTSGAQQPQQPQQAQGQGERERERGSIPTSLMVVRGVPVLATRPPSEDAKGAAADGVIVLSLLPEEAERVALAVTRGRVFLALQQRQTDTSPVPPVRMPDLIAPQ